MEGMAGWGECLAASSFNLMKQAHKRTWCLNATFKANGGGVPGNRDVLEIHLSEEDRNTASRNRENDNGSLLSTVATS